MYLGSMASKSTRKKARNTKQATNSCRKSRSIMRNNWRKWKVFWSCFSLGFFLDSLFVKICWCFAFKKRFRPWRTKTILKMSEDQSKACSPIQYHHKAWFIKSIKNRTINKKNLNKQKIHLELKNCLNLIFKNVWNFLYTKKSNLIQS